MKRIFILAVTAMIVGCSSVQKNNELAAKLHSEVNLKKDVDYTYRKMQQLHPNLYWYISKKDLDYKFDSLKTTITKPMTSFEFYKKISPVVASVRQGHMSVVPVVKVPTKAEGAALQKKGVGPFSQFEFEIFDNKMFVVKNKSLDKSIVPGTEVVAINNVNTIDLFNNYNTWFASDGFNKTFKQAKLIKAFPNFYSQENGLKDSLAYNFKFNDSLRVVNIRRAIVDTTKPAPKAAKKVLTELEKKQQKEKNKALSRKKSVEGFNILTKEYNRNLRFMEADSSVAVMKIKGFSVGNPYAFYSESFKKIKKNNAKTLILDLRNNPGGSLSEIADLYSYLSDSTYVFTDKSEVTSKTSLLHADYFRGGGIVSKFGKLILAPLYVGYTFFKVRKDENGKYFYSSAENKPKKISPNAFKGKVYVLINGGSFSASCIISSNLKGSKRAYFVGEETGGAYNGTVAGRMPLFTMPHSKTKVRIGLMFIAPNQKTDQDGRGIFPDKEIIPTIQDRVSGNDPEMNWILGDIKNTSVPLTETAAN